MIRRTPCSTGSAECFSGSSLTEGRPVVEDKNVSRLTSSAAKLATSA
jgi:hypothetical protein